MTNVSKVLQNAPLVITFAWHLRKHTHFFSKHAATHKQWESSYTWQLSVTANGQSTTRDQIDTTLGQIFS